VIRRRLRISGRPPSANGASSLHLVWQVPQREPLVEVAATLCVPAHPAVDRLYFWARQAAFAGGGGAHLGLQWGADAPRRRRHVNWGGYGAGGGELAGTVSPLPSSFGNPNTRDLDWVDGRRHRLRIRRVAAGWEGSVDGLVVRALHAGGDFLHSPMVWSEVFADCDAPPVEVRWSGLEVVTASGERHAVPAVTTSYQRRADGGCDNTSSWVDGAELVQATATPRAAPAGTVLTVE
jgi:hypothetical protein